MGNHLKRVFMESGAGIKDGLRGIRGLYKSNAQ